MFVLNMAAYNLVRMRTLGQLCPQHGQAAWHLTGGRPRHRERMPVLSSLLDQQVKPNPPHACLQISAMSIFSSLLGQFLFIFRFQRDERIYLRQRQQRHLAA